MSTAQVVWLGDNKHVRTNCAILPRLGCIFERR